MAQVHTGQSKTEQRVNEHMQKTGKKIEIEGAKKELELKKNAPKTLRPDPIKSKETFKVYTQPYEPDPRVFPDQYDHSVGRDPSMEFEQDIHEVRTAPTPEQENAAFIRQFKENAAKAGIDIKIDSNYKARPVKGGNTGR